MINKLMYKKTCIILICILLIFINSCSQIYNIKDCIIDKNQSNTIQKIIIDNLLSGNDIEITVEKQISNIIEILNNINCNRKNDTIEVSDSENQPMYILKIVFESSEYWLFVFSSTEFSDGRYRYNAVEGELDLSLLEI